MITDACVLDAEFVPNDVVHRDAKTTALSAALDPVTQGEPAYRERADDPKTERTVRNHLQKLEHYNLITAEGENRGRMYRAVS